MRKKERAQHTNESSVASPQTFSMPLLDTLAAAKLLGKESGRTLEKWRLLGCGPRYIRLGRSIRYRPEDLARFVEECASTHSSRGAA